jgi:hypothetical protein
MARGMNSPTLRLSLALLCVAPSLAPAESPAAVIISEDFETTAVGGIPKGFTKTGALAVAEDAAHSGKRALRIEPAVKGARVITLTGEPLAKLGGQFWGRLYFKVKLPTPLPVVPEGKSSAGIHTTLVSGKCTSPLFNDPLDLRMLGTSTDMTGSFKYLYNVQPRTGRKEFGVGTKAKSAYTDQWTLAEWSVDYATQSYQLFINGEEMKDVTLQKGAGKFEGVELPAVFETLSIGWNNYQPATGEGFTVWIDDLALGKKRLGPSGAAPATTRK